METRGARIRVRVGARSHLKGVLVDGLDDLQKGHLGGERVSVIDDRFSSVPVPAVQLHAATAMDQSSGGQTSRTCQNPEATPQHIGE